MLFYSLRIVTSSICFLIYFYYISLFKIFYNKIRGWLAHLVSWFTCNTIADARARVHRFNLSNCCNKILESNHQVNEQKLTPQHQSIKWYGNSLRWQISSSSSRKIRYRHLTCKVSHKCLNIRERVEVTEWNKTGSPNFSYCTASCRYMLKKTLIEKKRKYFENVNK